MSEGINVSASCFLPAALFSLHLTAKLARGAGFAGLEALPFRGPVLDGIPKRIAIPVETAHGHFNPIPAWKKARESGLRAVITDWVLFPPNSWCEKFLAQLRNEGVSVNTYFPNDLRQKLHVYSSFQLFPRHPFDETLHFLEETEAKVTYDLCHVRQSDREGRRTLPEWRESWKCLHSKDLVDNVHVQPLNQAELEAMWEGNKNVEISEMLRTIGDNGYRGPITLEVSPLDVVQIIGWRAFLPRTQVHYLSRFRAFVEDQLK